MPTNIPYQPIQFGLPDDLTKPDLFRQLIHEDDKLNFQVKADIGITNLITPGLGNYTQDPAAQWVISGGLFKALGNDGRIYQSVLTVGNYYKIEINILSLNTNGEVEVSLGTNTIATITSEGEQVLWGQCIGNNEFSIYADATTEVTVENSVQAYEVNDEIFISAISLDGDVELLSVQSSFVKRDISVFQDIDLPDFNCFYLNASNLGSSEYSDDFSSSVGWTLNNTTITGGELVGEDMPVGIDNGAESDISVNYEQIRLFEINCTACTNVNFHVTILDDDDFPVWESEVYNTAGIKRESLILPAQTSTLFRIIISADPTDADNLLEITSFSFYQMDEAIVSNTFKKISNTNGIILMEGSNDSDCFGFTFDNDFQFNLRFNGDVQMFLPEDEAEIYKDSRGVKKLYYAESEETQQIAFDAAPIYIVRAIQKMRLLNNLLLDGVEKVIFDNDFEIETDSEKMSTGSFRVTDKEQDYFNFL